MVLLSSLLPLEGRKITVTNTTTQAIFINIVRTDYVPGTVGDLPYSCEVKVLVAQSYPMLCDRMDRNPPGSSIHGILQARILEWVAIPFSRESS